jgi:hypothetical protein
VVRNEHHGELGIVAKASFAGMAMAVSMVSVYARLLARPSVPAHLNL